MRFKRITLSINGTMASSSEYEILKTKDGADASYYWGDWQYNKLVRRAQCREAHRILSKEEYGLLATEFCRLGVPSWNGFSGNNPDVLDGEMFFLEIVLDDDSVINAHGTNAYPKNYDKFYKLLTEAVSDK